MWARSVSALTARPQAGLPTLPYACGVDPLNFSSPAERIAWAIERSGKTLHQLADEIGCSHAALSQWQNGETSAANIKAGLLQKLVDLLSKFRISWINSTYFDTQSQKTHQRIGQFENELIKFLNQKT